MKGLRLVRLIAMIIGLAIIASGMVFLAVGLKEKDDLQDWYYADNMTDFAAMEAKYGFDVDPDYAILQEKMDMTDFGVTMVKWTGSESDNARLDAIGLIEEHRQPIYDADIKILIAMAIVTGGAIIFILSYLLLDRSSFLSGMFPKGEKSSAGISGKLVSFLSYLTFGLVGLVFFFIEKQSRFVKHNAIQALLSSILVVIAFLAAVLMNLIFSFMFPPIAYLLETFRFAIVSYALSTAICSILVSIFGRSFKLPFVGNLSENSSYCD